MCEADAGDAGDVFSFEPGDDSVLEIIEPDLAVATSDNQVVVLDL